MSLFPPDLVKDPRCILFTLHHAECSWAPAGPAAGLEFFYWCVWSSLFRAALLTGSLLVCLHKKAELEPELRSRSG